MDLNTMQGSLSLLAIGGVLVAGGVILATTPITGGVLLGLGGIALGVGAAYTIRNLLR